jgi:hypothetical protein
MASHQPGMSVLAELAVSQGCSAGRLAGPSFPQGLINQKNAGPL